MSRTINRAIPLAPRIGLSATLILAIYPAWAHHAMDGSTPTTWFNGLVSGLAHPIIGIDHFAFIVGVGVLAAYANRKLLIATTFLAATLIGTVLMLNGVVMPGNELVVALSVLILGGVIVVAKPFASAWGNGLFAVAGVFHGYAYAESIVGAESTPLLGYLVGFTIIQGVMVMLIAKWLAHGVDASGTSIRRYASSARVMGGVLAGVALVLLGEHLEQALIGQVVVS